MKDFKRVKTKRVKQKNILNRAISKASNTTLLNFSWISVGLRYEILINLIHFHFWL